MPCEIKSSSIDIRNQMLRRNLDPAFENYLGITMYRWESMTFNIFSNRKRLYIYISVFEKSLKSLWYFLFRIGLYFHGKLFLCLKQKHQKFIHLNDNNPFMVSDNTVNSREEKKEKGGRKRKSKLQGVYLSVKSSVLLGVSSTRVSLVHEGGEHPSKRRRIKVLRVQAATDSYIYTYRGFSISRFVECARGRRG